MEESRVGLHADRLADEFDGRFVLPDLVRDHAEQVQRVGMVRLGLQYLEIDLPGSFQPAALMVADRKRQCLRNGCHGFQRCVASGEWLVASGQYHSPLTTSH